VSRWRQGAVVVPVVLVVAVVVAALTLRDPDDASGPETSVAPPASSPSTAGDSDATGLPADGAVDPDAWCLLFRDFAAANSTYVATPDETTADELVRAGTALLDAGRPLGLDEAGFTSLGELVGGALVGAGGPSPSPAGPADQAALDGYLATTCPA
jgi:hypothetical protein